MKKTLALIGIAAGLSTATVAHAEIGIAASAGTTGLGVHLSVPLHQQLNARIGANAFDYSYDGSTSDLDYDFKLKLKTFDALLDYFPLNGAFRITGGVVYNGNKFDAVAKPNGGSTYTINGRSYSASNAGTINGQIDFRNVAPYLGIGWGNAVAKDKGWGFSSDIGVLFQGSPRTSLTNSGCTADPLVCAQLATDVAAENRELQDEAKDFKAYPVLRVGVTYRF